MADSPSGDSEKLRISESEIDFWDKWASDNESLIEHGMPTPEDLGDSFLTSDLAFLKRIGDVDGLDVLDVGCGLGALSIYLADKGANIVGIDIAQGMVSRCRKRSHLTGKEAQFVVCDAEHLPFRDCSFDKVVGSRVIHHFPNIHGFFVEARRVLRRNGNAIFIEPQRKNPIVEFNRKVLRPKSRTPDEHPLVARDIEDALKEFPEATFETFYLISPIAFFFRFLLRSDSLFRLTSRALQNIEKPFISVNALQSYCWQILLTLRKGERADDCDQTHC